MMLQVVENSLLQSAAGGLRLGFVCKSEFSLHLSAITMQSPAFPLGY